MGNDIVAAFAEAREDASVGAVVVTGAGRGFCAGVDLERLMESRAEAEQAGTRLGEEPFLRTFPEELRNFPKPTIAAVNGPAIGVGITFILPFDLRIAAAGVKMAVPFTKLGMLPGLGSTHLLPALIGPVKAKELVLTARTILSEEAERIGLVNQVVPGEELLATVGELARELASRDPRIMAAAKRALHYGAEATMGEALKNEQREGNGLRSGS
jgi:2-(1,2-epoxy-1,2-dihydrophenyl)acetyl-CoA isomerase